LEEIAEKLFSGRGEQQPYPTANSTPLYIALNIKPSSLRFYTAILFLVGLANIALFGWAVASQAANLTFIPFKKNHWYLVVGP
jgi:hypothetical protein